ncbi:MAG: 2-amino-4-hydroxy-6-hydroxymethyldihydropteridine diphosphokinase [Coriobacteriales bacterium]|jgi:2-amino-4-hydroxy-6-hydroxymethyldihydropteridine diphosphokinase|nr:2-amino-4-hydroxy-6-hydroxymethyldihydropteridine diphosphokinase [Coriobacteriales bacterium]
MSDIKHSRLAVIALGSNMGDSRAYVRKAAEEVAGLPGISLVKMSKLYQSEPAHVLDQDIFTNAVMTVEVDNTICALDLLHALQAIEIANDRVRHEHWGPRTLDLDIIDIQGELSDTEELRIPHPYALVRDFVVTPLLEIAPDYVLANGKPVTKDTVEYGAVISVE